MEFTEQERKFLIGLERLTRDTGIGITGCGCCGSPRLTNVDITNEKSGYGFGGSDQILWIDPLDEYDWKEYSQNIIKTVNDKEKVKISIPK